MKFTLKNVSCWYKKAYLRERNYNYIYLLNLCKNIVISVKITKYYFSWYFKDNYIFFVKLFNNYE